MYRRPCTRIRLVVSRQRFHFGPLFNESQKFLQDLVKNTEIEMADRPKITAEKQSVDFNQFGTWNFVKVCLSNEKRHNALTPAMMLDLVDIVDRIKSNGENGLSDERTVAIVLTGSGKSFCAGLGKI